jgi:hypothetical protein
MARSLAVRQSRVVPVAVEEAFAGTLPIPLWKGYARQSVATLAGELTR